MYEDADNNADILIPGIQHLVKTMAALASTARELTIKADDFGCDFSFAGVTIGFGTVVVDSIIHVVILQEAVDWVCCRLEAVRHLPLHISLGQIRSSLASEFLQLFGSNVKVSKLSIVQEVWETRATKVDRIIKLLGKPKQDSWILPHLEILSLPLETILSLTSTIAVIIEERALAASKGEASGSGAVLPKRLREIHILARWDAKDNLTPLALDGLQAIEKAGGGVGIQ